MIKFNFSQLAIALSIALFVTTPNAVVASVQNNLTKVNSLVPDKLPAGYKLLEGETIISIGDLDLDGMADAVAFCKKEGLQAGFVVYLSKSNQYVYSEFEDFNGEGEPMTRKASLTEKSIKIECLGLYAYDKLAIGYDAVKNELYFQRFEFEYSMNNHEVWHKGLIYLSNGKYVGNKNGKSITTHPTRISISRSKEFLDLTRAY
jgi:hypothetical protein